MSLKDKIIAQLRKQQQIEGYTPETALLLKVIHCVKTSSEWQALVKVKFHRYGKASFSAYRFHYPSDVLLNLESLFTKDQETL